MEVHPKLIALCIRQDRKAEYELYRLSYSYLMSICLRYSKDRDSASESLNMGYMKILTKLKTYKPEVPFKAWMRRIMINTLIDQYRKNRRESERVKYVDHYFDSSSFSEANEAIGRIDVQQIYELINKLPEASRNVFNLFVIDGFSHKEIAEMLDISEGTSKWHLNAARQKLKEEIEITVFSRVQK
ncbi:MAG: RNA polymerase sigma factor [Bacteroidia bacterium]|jgi:RNA polymerase sigma-70 factor (ECF subfamily)|nr:RNA polymerase sigma factor [Bacteroidia bacterium]